MSLLAVSSGSLLSSSSDLVPRDTKTRLQAPPGYRTTLNNQTIPLSSYFLFYLSFSSSLSFSSLHFLHLVDARITYKLVRPGIVIVVIRALQLLRVPSLFFFINKPSSFYSNYLWSTSLHYPLFLFYTFSGTIWKNTCLSRRDFLTCQKVSKKL